ncbi:NRPS-like enzyme, putative [Talaromyces stipitatus ATCC 10500]|uniref:NRPS-like enzyme, putative n=1 Tax=Talaromyces stipitatus (strain ATCC 10500 / CBS 375.48 / QM 6759 / NRRL 1006) TaxID=441959 RepID=B8MPJ0_TALSN|nr:NRPS-like enzyme, putative [Talaromyces stipitatus ATCC 10500]EED14429.1 NRPS-like enzyme, putative [Talaromyces stipitatus ATCC 10500]
MGTTVALLAVLKAGAAFCMLDPAHPAGRLQSIVQQTGAIVILSSPSNLTLSSSLAPVRVVTVSSGSISHESNTSHKRTLPPSDPTSVMAIVFTSGSTGVPKGSIIRHSAFFSSIHYPSRRLGFNSMARVLDIAAHAFDMFVLITVVTLATGGCLYVLSDMERKNELVKSIAKAASTLIAATPTLACLMQPEMHRSVEAIIMGGELLTHQHVQKWWNHARIIDVYGPSECTPVSVVSATYLLLCLDRPSVSLNYFSLHFGIDTDIDRLTNACALLVERVPILRTVFNPSFSIHEQIVLRKLEPSCQVVRAAGDIDTTARRLIDTDKKQKLLPAPPFVAFFIVCHETLGHRLVVRISHAQYDGVCLPLIVRALLALYHKENVMYHPPFSKYLAYTQKRMLKSGTHWRKILQGAQVTSLRQVSHANKPIGNMPVLVHAKCSIPVPELPRNLTLATLASTAWALALYSLTGKCDVVYGQVVSGRNASIPNVSEIIGLCANIVPHTALELLNRVQYQFVSIAQSDSMGLHDVIDRCTDWPSQSDLDSVLQHVGSDRIPTFLVGGKETQIRWFEHEHVNFSYIKVHSTIEDNRLGLYISGDGTCLTSEGADALLGSLRAAVGFLSLNLEKQLKDRSNESQPSIV